MATAMTAQRNRKAQLSVEGSGHGSTYLFHLFTRPFAHHRRGHRCLFARKGHCKGGWCSDLTDGRGERSSVLNFSFLT